MSAKKSSFYWAMRLMPRAQREAMFAVYDFCRAVDDIADDGHEPAEALARLEAWRGDIAAVYEGRVPVGLADLAAAVARFALKREDFLAVIEGMEMDVRRAIGAGNTDWALLDHYCDCVASAVGRLCVPIFGVEAAEGVALAHHLGRALQLTNILRDIDEDAMMDRCYLPMEAGALEPACRAVAGRAREHFAAARALLAHLPRSVARTPRIMAEAYGYLLDQLEARGWQEPRLPVKLSKLRVLGVIARCYWPWG